MVGLLLETRERSVPGRQRQERRRWRRSTCCPLSASWEQRSGEQSHEDTPIGYCSKRLILLREDLREGRSHRRSAGRPHRWESLQSTKGRDKSRIGQDNHKYDNCTSGHLHGLLCFDGGNSDIYGCATKDIDNRDGFQFFGSCGNGD